MMKYGLIALLAALVVSVSLPASAQVPRTMSYQGILTDNLGNPVADGNYSLTIRLYDDPAAGNLVYTEAHPVVAVAGGGFNVILGSITPLTLNFDKPLWLSLQVGAAAELAPRVELASSPYAMGLSLPFDGRANGATATVTLRNTTGPALKTEGGVTVTNGSGLPNAIIQDFSGLGGQIISRDEANNSVIRLEPDANGTGGFLAVYRNAASQGFSVNGNSGSEEPQVNVIGSSRSVQFDMSQAGDASVELPASSINSLELLNEPGVAESYQNAAIQVGNGVTLIGSRTITVPDDGYVIAIASGHSEMGHVNGTDSRVLYGANDQNGVFASSIGVAGVPSVAPSGNYRNPLPFTGVWPVTPGAHTFYLLAQKIGAANGVVWNDPTLTLIYVPTAYGTVTGNKAVGPPSPEAPAVVGISDIEAEKSEAAAFDQRRVEAELDRMRAQLEAIQLRLSNEPPAGAAPRK